MRTRPDMITLPTTAPSGRRRSLFARAASEPVTAHADGERTLIRLFGPITNDANEGLTPEQFIAQLPSIGDVTVSLHSPGGDPFAGTAMFNALVAHPGHVRIEIPALAASAASIVAMAGDTVAIGPNAHLMIHSCSSICIGPARHMRREAGVLDSIDRALIETYRARTGIPAKELAQMLEDESWMMGKDAIAKGFADELLTGPQSKVSASFDLRAVYSRVPDSIATPDNELSLLTMRVVEAIAQLTNNKKNKKHHVDRESFTSI